MLTTGQAVCPVVNRRDTGRPSGASSLAGAQMASQSFVMRVVTGASREM